LAIRLGTGKAQASPKLVSETIHKYARQNPLEQQVDGSRFKEKSPEELDHELFRFTPERILIVERNDIADMLLLNRFYLDQKTLVVSMHRYPEPAYQAAEHFLSENPYFPIHIMHDASKEGFKMKESLETHRDWKLNGKDITDLGLFIDDVSQLKNPIWRPTGRTAFTEGDPGPGNKDPRDIIAAGYRMPVDVAPPRAFMHIGSLAVGAWSAMLTPELLDDRTPILDDDSCDVVIGGGFGGFGGDGSG
jgi:hypothetical protein